MKTPKTIKAPYLKVANMFEYTDLWNNFEDQYNKDKKNRERLKKPHKDLFYKIIQIASENLRFRNKILQGSELMAIRNDMPLRVSTNRLELKKRAFRNSSTTRTISNYINRLMEAKVISEKKFHGTKSDFELLINPDFLLIYDFYDENYKPLSKYSTEKIETVKRIVREAKLKNFQVLFSDNLLKASNKLIITKGATLTFRKNDWTSKNISENISENTPQASTEKKSSKTPTSYKNELKTEKEKNSAKKEKEAKELPQTDPYKAMIVAWANIFYLYMQNKLFKNHTINPVQKEKTIAYIAEHYFFESKRWYNEKEIEKLLHHYQERIDLAEAYVERANYDTRWIFPLYYLDVNSSNGFRFKNTKEWHERRKKTYAKREVQKIANDKKASDIEKLNRMIKLFAKNRNEIQLNYCNNYVKNVLPKYQNAFHKGIRELTKA